MTSGTTKRACDLVEGDQILRGTDAARVLSIVPSTSVQTVRKPVLIVTVQLENGRSTHLTYSPNTPVAVASKGATP